MQPARHFKPVAKIVTEAHDSEIRAGIDPVITFSPNAAKMATPETFSETGSETMYEKV